MKLFRLKGKPGSGEEVRELVLDTDAEAQAPAPEGALVIQIYPEADNETKAEETTPASELADIPIQDLLSDLVGVSRRLGITPRAHGEADPDEAVDAHAEPCSDEPRDASTEPDRDEARDVDPQPAEEDDAAVPDGPGDPQTERPSPTGYRRYALHGLLLSLAVVAAVGGLMGAERLARTEPTQDSPIVVATVPGVAPEQDGQAETAAEPTLEAAPEPTPELQPAYFLYTVQPGDAVFAIARAFAISPDYILWNNPDVIYDPNLVLVGEELLIPSVDGIIYHVKPGDTLSDIAALHQIDVESILSFVPNSLTSADNAIAGMVLVLPGAVPPALSGAVQTMDPMASESEPTDSQPEPELPSRPSSGHIWP